MNHISILSISENHRLGWKLVVVEVASPLIASTLCDQRKLKVGSTFKVIEGQRKFISCEDNALLLLLLMPILHHFLVLAQYFYSSMTSIKYRTHQRQGYTSPYYIWKYKSISSMASSPRVFSMTPFQVAMEKLTRRAAQVSWFYFI